MVRKDLILMVISAVFSLSILSETHFLNDSKRQVRTSRVFEAAELLTGAYYSR